MTKKWKILGKLPKKFSTGNRNPETFIKEVLKVVLANRGLKTKKETDEFLNPLKPHDLTPKQVGVDEKELKKALTRIKKAIKEKEKIIVYGDYDTDGVCATAIVWETLYNLGAKVMPYIPKRGEGYGMRETVLDGFGREGVGLVITVDQGITAYPQVKHAKKLGIDVIVTDHHLQGGRRLPAYAVVHTRQLSGAGVAWFLALQLDKKISLDLVSVATVTDMMPLLGVNRSIVKYGFSDLGQTKRPGVLALYEMGKIDREKIGSYEVGFLIGPRLNASGRIDDPMDALRLVCVREAGRAQDLAGVIEKRNSRRQDLTEQMLIHARGVWLAEKTKGNLIFVSDESYDEGIVGLVAGKLQGEFYRPVVVVAVGEKEGRGSARSIEGFNIVDALNLSSDLLLAHGGHPMAAGFTVEKGKVEKLKKELVSLANKKLKETELTPTLKVDLEIPLKSLSFSFLEKLSQFGPFGNGNPEPVFLTCGLEVVESKTVGSSNHHLKLKVKDPSSTDVFDAICFGLGDKNPQLGKNVKIDVVYNFVSNQWNGEESLQLRVKDLKVQNGKSA